MYICNLNVAVHKMSDKSYFIDKIRNLEINVKYICYVLVEKGLK